MKSFFRFLSIVFIFSFSVWLFLYDRAAQPGSLSGYHNDVNECEACHEPWNGVTEERCFFCHDLADPFSLRKEIRFHETGTRCLKCHKEHGMLGETISNMDHTVLHGDLLCSACHFDKHDGLFGSECRTCHSITTWKIPGYRHPVTGRKDCFKCHKAPESHYDKRFWNLIVDDMEEHAVSPSDCWRCHTIRHWPHLVMRHDIKSS
jgi:hypothetical protein